MEVPRGFGVFGEDFGKEDVDNEDETKVRIQLVDLSKRTLCCAVFRIGKQCVCLLLLEGDGFCQYRSPKGPPPSWKGSLPGPHLRYPSVPAGSKRVSGPGASQHGVVGEGRQVLRHAGANLILSSLALLEDILSKLRVYTRSLSRS
jgi:hypothetical protein